MTEKSVIEPQRLAAGDPIDLLDEEHRLFLDACAAFECVADGLPDEADLSLAESAAEVLLRHQPHHYEDECKGLFPLVRSKIGNSHTIARVIDQLESHRAQDIDVLTEIAEVLHAGAGHKRPSNPGMFGYMLRSYFTSERRQIAWERQIVMPAARLLLSQSELQGLARRLHDSERFEPGTSEEPFTVRRAITPGGQCWACYIKSPTH